MTSFLSPLLNFSPESIQFLTKQNVCKCYILRGVSNISAVAAVWLCVAACVMSVGLAGVQLQ